MSKTTYVIARIGSEQEPLFLLCGPKKLVENAGAVFCEHREDPAVRKRWVKKYGKLVFYARAESETQIAFVRELAVSDGGKRSRSTCHRGEQFSNLGSVSEEY